MDFCAPVVERVIERLCRSWEESDPGRDAAFHAAKLVFGRMESAIPRFFQNSGAGSGDDLHEGGQILSAVQSRFS
jgi:hypothetical protein